jgi:hypothetical protein
MNSKPFGTWSTKEISRREREGEKNESGLKISNWQE